jgi:hypothetical protein
MKQRENGREKEARKTEKGEKVRGEEGKEKRVRE